jgi:hypothetical protein
MLIIRHICRDQGAGNIWDSAKNALLNCTIYSFKAFAVFLFSWMDHCIDDGLQSWLVGPLPRPQLASRACEACMSSRL